DVQVVIRAECSGQRGFLAGKRFDADGGVRRLAVDPVDRAGERTSEGVVDSQPLERPDDVMDDLYELRWLVHGVPPLEQSRIEPAQRLSNPIVPEVGRRGVGLPQFPSGRVELAAEAVETIQNRPLASR